MKKLNTPSINWQVSASAVQSNPGQGLILDASGSTQITCRTNNSDRLTITDSSSVLFTNLDISGNGLRLRGNFSNSITTNRLLLQTLVPNGSSVVGIVPNGTSLIAGLACYSTFDASNASVLSLRTNPNANEVRFETTYNGSGTALPMKFYYTPLSGGGLQMTIDSSVNFTNLPNCSIAPSLSADLVNKAYVDNIITSNVIVNGAMQVDQANNFTAVTIASTGTVRCPDKWWTFLTTSSGGGGIVQSKLSSSSVNPPNGIPYYYSFTKNASAATVGSSDFNHIRHYIEGRNIAPFLWGTVNAKQAVLSFYVYSSAGSKTLGGAIANSPVSPTPPNRSYPFSYTITNANTWERKTVIISGPITGVFDDTSNLSLYGAQIYFDLGSGSNYKFTPGAWNNNALFGATGTDQFPMNTANAYLYITGIQLQMQSIGPFLLNSYNTDLMACQRYYVRWGTPVGAATSVVGATPIYPSPGKTASPATSGSVVIDFPVPMRIAMGNYTNQITFTNLSFDDQVFHGAGITAINVTGTNRATTQSVSLVLTINSGLNTYALYWITSASNGASFLALSAESSGGNSTTYP